MFKRDYLLSRTQMLKETQEEIKLYLQDNLSSKKEIEYINSLFETIYFRLKKIDIFLDQNENRF